MSGNSGKVVKPAGGPLQPTALDVDSLVRLLAAASGQMNVRPMVEAAIAAGAPVVEGKVNLVNFMAWLEQQSS